MKKVLIVMGVAASLVACNTKSSTESTEVAAQKEVVGVKVVTAERVVVDLYETYTSEIKAYKENDITPAVQGLHIDQIKVDVGDRVKEGQVLVTMDQATLKQQELNLATTQDSYNRMKPVHEAGGVADQQMIQLKNQLDLQKEVVENLRKNSTIKSPISGIVTARNFESDDLFASMPILHIMQINKLKVKANVSEMYYPVVKVGQKVDIEVDIFPGEKFEGKVTRINPALDAATRTFGVEITIDNANERLRPGMYARTTFNMGQKESIVINDVAVQKQSGSSARYVYVIKDGKADYRFVEDGRHIGNKLQILSGIEEGEQIAITSFNRLVEGAEVEIINE